VTAVWDAPSEARPSDARWKGLFRVGGGTGIAIALILLAEFAAYAMIPDPGSGAGDNLALFVASPLSGLLSFDLLGMVGYLLFVPTMLALYVALRRHSEGAMLIATAFFFVGIADFFATNTAFPMLALSRQYALANTPEERLAILAAAQAMIALFEDNAFLLSYVIVSFSWLMISTVMLRSEVFGRLTGTMGILAGAAGMLAVVLEHSTFANAVDVAIALYFLAIVFLMLWLFLAGTRLLKLGGRVPTGST
jgi:hypothetical protein